MNMTKYRLAIAVLWGLGFTALLSLLLNLSLAFGIFLFPGGILAAVLSNPKVHPMAVVFAANTVMYGLAVFVVISLRFRNTGSDQLRRFAGFSLLPVITLAALAGFPRLNPLWPNGMPELAQQESELQNAIQPGMGLEQVREVLTSKRIRFTESAEPTGGIVLQNPPTTMTAQIGDTVLVSRFHTEAFEFPCGYDMEVVLLFGRDGKVRERYIRRFPMCP
jgi:hypothetical protein